MPWNLVGSLGSAVLGGVFGSIAQDRANRTNIALAREANQTNYQIHKETQQYNTDMWNRNNAYNDPAAQRARYEAAGINPFIAHGAVDAGSATLTQSGDPAPMQAPQVAPSNPFSGLGSAFDAFREDRSARMFKYQERMAEAEAVQAEVRAYNAAKRAGLENDDLASSIRLKSSQADFNIFNVERGRELLTKEKELVIAQIDKYRSDIDATQVINELNESKVRYTDEQRGLISYQASQLMASARYLKSQAALADANVRLTDKKIVSTIMESYYTYNKAIGQSQNNDYFGSVMSSLVSKAVSEASIAESDARSAKSRANMLETDERFHTYNKVVDSVDKTGKAVSSVVGVISDIMGLILSPGTGGITK